MNRLITQNYEVSDKYFDRAMASIEFEPNTGCWLWGGPVNMYGYGVLATCENWVKRWLVAHRAVYTRIKGPVPPDRYLDHKCRTRCCVNPDHLRVVEWVTNVLENSDGPCAKNLLKTHCPQGHEYTEENTYCRPGPKRSRDCKTCRDERNALYNARRKAGR